MRNLTAGIIGGVSSVAFCTAAIVGFSLTSEGAPGGVAGRPVTTPVESPHATVAPGVASEMNGKMGKVDMAGKVPMHAAKPVPKSLVGKGQGNGCFKQYGEPGQCLPLLSPAQQAMPDMDHPWTCDEVRKLFPDGVKVTSSDPLGLDSNKDRVLCGPGDG